MASYSKCTGKGFGSIRMALMGETGTGKSSSGNTIIGKNVFRVASSFSSVTSKCETHEVVLDGKKVLIADTPGLFDTNVPLEHTIREISRFISMTTPGPHIFLYFMRIGRITEQNLDSLRYFFKQFGNAAKSRTIFVFTRGDELNGKTIDKYLSSAPSYLLDAIAACGGRVAVLENRPRSSSNQVQRLLKLAYSTMIKNGNACYTNEMYNENKKLIEKQASDLKAKNKEKWEKERKKIEERMSNKLDKQMKSEETRKRKLVDHLNQCEDEFTKTKETVSKKSKSCSDAAKMIEDLHSEINKQERVQREQLQKEQKEAEEKAKAAVEAVKAQNEAQIAAMQLPPPPPIAFIRPPIFHPFFF